MEDAGLLAKYQQQVAEHIQKEEYKDALRKINNILEQSDADLGMIEMKVSILCTIGDIEKAEQFLNLKENMLKKL